MPVAHFGVRPDDVRAECAPPKAFEKWQPELRAKAEAAGADSGPFVIDVMDVIGESWDGYGITGRRVGALLRSAGDRDVVVNINSPGGDVFEGLAIYNMLRGHKGDVTVRIVGLAASAASVIAMAGDKIEIARAGFLMIHNTWVFAIGDRHDLSTVAGQSGRLRRGYGRALRPSRQGGRERDRRHDGSRDMDLGSRGYRPGIRRRAAGCRSDRGIRQG
ncbi:MAG: Clp protease ClpP [Paracoccus aminovorans]|nr:Clp protease ClpP [Paracoccus aminovorans]